MNDFTKSSELKSKIMSLGNRLAAKGRNRSSAFIQAWAIVRAGGLVLAVKGITFGNRQEALRRLATYNPSQVRTWLVPEPENKQDPEAIAVMVGVQNGRGLYRLGYIPSDMTMVISALRGQLPALRVVSGLNIYGARLALAV